MDNVIFLSFSSYFSPDISFLNGLKDDAFLVLIDSERKNAEDSFVSMSRQQPTSTQNPWMKCQSKKTSIDLNPQARRIAKCSPHAL